MLRITPNKSAAGATRYFDEGLSKSDYYAEKGEIIGMWGGEGAKLLNLSGEVTKEGFEKLCYNINPSDDTQLTARNAENRRIGYDFTFSVPKSVSIIYGQTKDKEILDAFNISVQETMKDIEKEALTRVRILGKSEDRPTGNLIWGNFTHDDARPVGGIPDPHLHQHVFVFNATFDPVEERWKAAQFGDIKADGQYFETLFHSRLADNLQKVGYEIERNQRDFEVTGFQRSTIEKFSNRTREINNKIDELGLTYAEDKAAVGAKIRASKRTGYDKEDIRLQWKSRLSEKEMELVFNAKKSNNDPSGGSSFGFADEKKKQGAFTSKDALDFALDHCLERKSTVTEKELMIAGLKRSYGSVSPAELKTEIKNSDNLFSKKETNGSVIYTTRQTLNEERQLRDTARNGRNTLAPINPDYQVKNDQLNYEQSQAVKHVLNSKDFITVVSGGAGTGKTWSIKEVAEGVKEKGLNFGAFAPSSVASRQVQKDDGFSNATTISELLQSKELQESVKNGVIWIDEAGMVGNQTMNQVAKIAKNQNARLLLTGDINQHGAVERGDALRIIEQYGGVKACRINQIQRQKTDDYRMAVKSISEGEIGQGFHILDNMGAIKEADSTEKLKENVAAEYVASVKAKEDVLIVATTHSQGRAVIGHIRDNLKASGILKGEEQKIEVQRSLSFTEAEKTDKANYSEGMLVQFHQNVKGGFKRGSRFEVKGQDGKGNVLVQECKAENDNTPKQMLQLPLKAAKSFTLYERESIGIAVGDKIRVTQNGFSNDNKRLNNGMLLSVNGFDQQGNILAGTGQSKLVIGKNYANITHGYYTTSPASQGKSVNRVIVMQGAETGKAASKEQFYVSASRGKFAISIHTDDKQNMLASVERTSQRKTAMELVDKTGVMMQMRDKLKKIGSIYRAGLSKVSKAYQEGRRFAEVLSMNSKPSQPVFNAPTRTK
jgi:conjugative relaxase-like TrwC/TraI family protein